MDYIFVIKAGGCWVKVGDGGTAIEDVRKHCFATIPSPSRQRRLLSADPWRAANVFQESTGIFLKAITGRVRISLHGLGRFQDVGAGETAIPAAMEIDPMPPQKHYRISWPKMPARRLPHQRLRRQ